MANTAFNQPAFPRPPELKLAGGRLTLTQDNPDPGSDQSAQPTLYYEPFISDKIWLYDGTSDWAEYTIAGESIAASGLTADKNYDIFAYDNSGLTLEAVAWTDDSNRATALVFQDGIRVKSGATDRLYLGTVRTISSSGTKFEDTLARRYVWNMYNQLVRPCRAEGGSGTHTYTTGSWREMNADSTYGVSRVGVVTGLDITLPCSYRMVVDTSASGLLATACLGQNGTNLAVTQSAVLHASTASTYINLSMGTSLDHSAGFSYYCLMEYGVTTLTVHRIYCSVRTTHCC